MGIRANFTAVRVQIGAGRAPRVLSTVSIVIFPPKHSVSAYSLCSGIPGGANIVPCPMNANGQWLYWCGQNSETNWCQQAANASLFEYPSGTALTIVGSNSSASGTCSSSSSSGTAAATSSLAPLQSCTEAQKQIDMMGVKVGIGVGVPLLVSALLLLVLWLLERKSRQKLSQQRISEAVPKRVENESLGMAASIAPIYELVGQMEPSELPSKRGTIQRPKPGTA